MQKASTTGDGLKAKLAPLIATPGVSSDLVKRLEKAMAEAERAKVEARAKAISDGVDWLVGGLTSLQLPSGFALPFQSAKARLAAVEEPEAPEPPPPPPTGLERIKARALNLIREMPPMA